jgi:hypothetical protein
MRGGANTNVVRVRPSGLGLGRSTWGGGRDNVDPCWMGARMGDTCFVLLMPPISSSRLLDPSNPNATPNLSVPNHQ